MSDTGGGHRASAEALKSGFQLLYGNQYHVRHLVGPFAYASHNLLALATVNIHACYYTICTCSWI